MTRRKKKPHEPLSKQLSFEDETKENDWNDNVFKMKIRKIYQRLNALRWRPFFKVWLMVDWKYGCFGLCKKKIFKRKNLMLFSHHKGM